MQQRSYFNITFSALVAVLVLLYWAGMWSYDYRTRLVPLVIGTPAVLLAFFVVINDLRARPSKRQQLPSHDIGIGSVRNLFFIIAWLFVFFVMTLFFGFLIAIPISVVLFLRFYQYQSWRNSIITSALTWLVTYVMFQAIMGFTLFQGVLFGGILM